MKTLILSTETPDCANHVRAFRSFAPCEHVTFDHMALIRNDWQLVREAERIRPDVVIYIGACKAQGNPHPSAFRDLQSIAPLINMVSDAGDWPWWPELARYTQQKCFTLQVSIDGAKPPHIDLATLTPVDPTLFVPTEKTIRAGFSGSAGKHSDRAEMIYALTQFSGLVVRPGRGTYEDHVAFLNKCRMVVNFSKTGTGQAHHIKGRVVEAGWAGCALLESEGSPIADWFPEDCYFSYRTAAEADEIINKMPDAEVERRAQRLAEEVRARFTPRAIYGSMLAKAGVTMKEAA